MKSPTKRTSSALAIGPAGLDGPMSGSAGSFSSIVELVNSSTSVQESGPAIVDDQPVTEFVAAIDPTTLAGWSELLSKSGGSLTKEIQKGGQAPTAKLELFLSSSGLPVRIRFSLRAVGTTVTFTSDTVALEVPVEVIAPPAREVIGEAQLKALEKKQAERESAKGRRQLLRICRKLSKQVARCRRAATTGK